MHVMQVAGAEVLVREIIHQLGLRIVPTVFCLDAVGTIGEELQREGVDVIALSRRPGCDWRLARRLAAMVREREIELLHAHQYTPLFYAVLAKALAGRIGGRRTKVLFTEHGRHYPDIVSWKRRTLNRLVFDRLTDATTAVCEFTRRSLIEVEGFSAERIETIENGIEVRRYRGGKIVNCKLKVENCKLTDDAAGPSSFIAHRSSLVPSHPSSVSARRASLSKSRLGLDPARRYITTIARFHPVKDHATLLRAFALVAAKRNDVDLLLAGDGSQREASESLAAELELTARVKFLGVRGDVPELLAASDVFALTSVSEAASLTLLEAMASGVPCVVTDVGGNPELVRDGVDGLLAPRGDAAAIAAAMLRILDDAELAASMGAAGAARVRERFRLEQTVERYYKLYRRLFGHSTYAR